MRNTTTIKQSVIQCKIPKANLKVTPPSAKQQTWKSPRLPLHPPTVPSHCQSAHLSNSDLFTVEWLRFQDLNQVATKALNPGSTTY